MTTAQDHFSAETGGGPTAPGRALPHLRRSASQRVVNVNAVYGEHPDRSFFATTVNRVACPNLTRCPPGVRP